MKIAVLGAGSWGTAMARLLVKSGHDVCMYTNSLDQLKILETKKENPDYLPGISLPENLTYTGKIQDLLDKDCVVNAVPTDACREVFQELKEASLGKDVILVNLAKGIENKSLRRISEIAEEILPDNAFVSLTGPSHAEEVARDIPTAVCVASKNIEDAKKIQKEFSTEMFRIYTNTDLIGAELGGSLKNIIALAAGLSDGLGYGDNTKAALMTRGMYEISKLAIELGGKPVTFHGLSGMGDLIVTCTSMHSRNRRCGILIGQGKSVEEATKEVGMVVEGIKTTKSAYDLSRKMSVNMPITEKLYGVLYEGKDPRQAVYSLMTRDSKEEIEEVFFL